MHAIWQEGTYLPHFPALRQNISADVLVVGGGLTGLLCAYYLEKAGVDTVVAEAGTIMNGVSGHTTAKITSQHGLIYTKLQKAFGTDTAAGYYRANQAALEQYRQLCSTIACDFETQDAYVFAGEDPAQVETEYRLVRSFGGRATLERDLEVPFPVKCAIRFPRQAQFHPVKFAAAIADGLQIYEQTPVQALQGTTAITPGGAVHAKHIVVATHFPFLRFRGGYFLKLYQQRSYVLALENRQPLSGMYLEDKPNGISLRSWGNLLLLGGGGHRTGKQGGGWPMLREFAEKYFPEAREAAHWATQDCMTLDGIPYIGAYGPGQYVATGFQKWGMTSAMVSAKLLTGLVQGQPSPWADIFSPARRILRPQLALNTLEALRGMLTPTAPRCPHVGCALKWNSQEHTWDCPCHGSRFLRDGTLITGPAQHGL